MDSSRPENVLFIVPARAGSKGVPNKNLRRLGGRTLIWHAVECSLNVPCRVGQTVVTTDIEGYRDDRVFTHLQRPADLAQDDTPMIAVVQHALAQIPGPDDQIIVLLQPTQPFRMPEHVKAAIALLRETQADSVVSVVELPLAHSPSFALGIHDGLLYCLHERVDWDTIPTRRQDVVPAYRRDGTVYAFRRETVQRYGTIYGQDVRPVIIPPDESCELDTEADWAQVEARWTLRAYRQRQGYDLGEIS